MTTRWLSLAVVAPLLAAEFWVIFHWDRLFHKPPPAPDLSGNFTEWANSVAHRYPPLDRLPFTPLLSCEPNTSLLMERFDWKVVPESAWKDLLSPAHANRSSNGTFDCCGPLDWMPWVEDTAVADPNTVWVAPHAVDRLLELLDRRRLDTKRPNRVVVFSGSEYPLSRAFGRNASERSATVKKLKKYFKRIVYQTKDILLEGVHVAPMGLCWGYFMSVLAGWAMQRDTKPVFNSYWEFGGLLISPIVFKSREILATKGMAAGWLSDTATMEVLQFLAAVGLPYPPSNSSLRAVATAFESRKRLERWMGITANSSEVTSPAAIAAGVEFRFFHIFVWWQELAKYKFLISPLGSGIQSAKNIEALLVLTIPIIQRMGFKIFDELVAIGFPFALVNGWVEITPANTSRWWAALSPRLESFRANCLTVEGYWQLYTGQVTYCA